MSRVLVFSELSPRKRFESFRVSKVGHREISNFPSSSSWQWKKRKCSEKVSDFPRWKFDSCLKIAKINFSCSFHHLWKSTSGRWNDDDLSKQHELTTSEPFCLFPLLSKIWADEIAQIRQRTNDDYGSTIVKMITQNSGTRMGRGGMAKMLKTPEKFIQFANRRQYIK